MKTLLERIGPGPWAISLLIKRLIARNIHALEYDPKIQYRFHQSFMFFWIVCMGVVWFMPTFKDFATRLIMGISLYANFSTDFGAMSSALAAESYHCDGCNCDANTPEFKH